MRNPLLHTMLAAAVVLVAPAAHASARAGGYSLELVDEAGSRLPTFQDGGRTYVLGAQGRRYSLHLHNNTGQRVEFVAAVDGRDVLDGQPSGWEKRGYIVNPYGDLVIDGFRLNTDSVAAFRFSSVRDSYASRMGDSRDVGVIGVAVFPEVQRYIPPPRPIEHYSRRGYDDYGAMKDAPADLSGPTGAFDKAGEAASPPASEQAMSGRDGMPAAKRAERPGLGTEFGEQRESRVYETEFERASSQPSVVLTVRYNDRHGLEAMGINLNPYYPRQYEAQLRESADPFRRDPGFSEPPPGWRY